MAFIVFEGLDGAGKSTLLELVESRLVVLGCPCVRTQDPGTTELAQEIRNLILKTDGETPTPKTELLLYQAARAQLVDQVLRPTIQRGHWALSDRFYSSTWAFQAHARNLAPEMVHKLNQFVSEDCHPDLFIFIDITLEESERRKKNRAKESGVPQDRMEKENRNFQEKVREGYLLQARQAPNKWLILNGDQKPDVLCDRVFETLRGKKWLD